MGWTCDGGGSIETSVAVGDRENTECTPSFHEHERFGVCGGRRLLKRFDDLYERSRAWETRLWLRGG